MKTIMKETALGAFCLAYGVLLYWVIAWISDGGMICL